MVGLHLFIFPSSILLFLPFSHLEGPPICACLGIFMIQPRLCLFWRVSLTASGGLPPLSSDHDCNLHDFLIIGQSCDITPVILYTLSCILLVTFHIFIFTSWLWTTFLRVRIRSYIPFQPYSRRLTSIPAHGRSILLIPHWYDPKCCQHLSSNGKPTAGPQRIVSLYYLSSPTSQLTYQTFVLITLNSREGFYIGLRPCSSIKVWIHKLTMVFTSSPAVPNAIECVCMKK